MTRWDAVADAVAVDGEAAAGQPPAPPAAWAWLVVWPAAAGLADAVWLPELAVPLAAAVLPFVAVVVPLPPSCPAAVDADPPLPPDVVA